MKNKNRPLFFDITPSHHLHKNKIQHSYLFTHLRKFKLFDHLTKINLHQFFLNTPELLFPVWSRLLLYCKGSLYFHTLLHILYFLVTIFVVKIRLSSIKYTEFINGLELPLLRHCYKLSFPRKIKKIREREREVYTSNNLIRNSYWKRRNYISISLYVESLWLLEFSISYLYRNKSLFILTTFSFFSTKDLWGSFYLGRCKRRSLIGDNWWLKNRNNSRKRKEKY